MQGVRDRYLHQLNQAAKAGQESFFPLFEARLWQKQGPNLQEDEESLLSVFLDAYQLASPEEQKVYRKCSLRLVQDFQNQWIDGVSKKESTILAFLMIFLGRIRLEDNEKIKVQSFLASVQDLEAEFRKVVPTPQHGIIQDLYGKIETFYLELISNKSSCAIALLKKLADLPLDNLQQRATQQSRYLKALAKTAPREVTLEQLHDFFQTSLLLPEEKQKKIRQNTFFMLQSLFSEEQLKRLLKETDEHLKSFPVRQKLTNHPEKRKETQRFIKVLAFLFSPIPKDYQKFQQNFELDLNTLTKTEESKRGVKTVPVTNKVIQFREKQKERQQNKQREKEEKENQMEENLAKTAGEKG